jgi:hypothetical protein
LPVNIPNKISFLKITNLLRTPRSKTIAGENERNDITENYPVRDYRLYQEDITKECAGDTNHGEDQK